MARGYTMWLDENEVFGQTFRIAAVRRCARSARD